MLGACKCNVVGWPLVIKCGRLAVGHQRLLGGVENLQDAQPVVPVGEWRAAGVDALQEVFALQIERKFCIERHRRALAAHGKRLALVPVHALIVEHEFLGHVVKARHLL